MSVGSHPSSFVALVKLRSEVLCRTASGSDRFLVIHLSIFRAGRGGSLTPWAADQVAIEQLGAHPADSWGDDWIVSIV